MERSTLLPRLDAETRAHHAHADAPWLALLAPDLRREDYVRHLVLTYGFEAPVESALLYTSGVRTLVGAHDRARCGLLAQDLLALCLTPAQITALPQCFSIAEFDDAAEALGWLYVIERTTMHHDAVRCNVLDRVASARGATSYLAAAQHNADDRWQLLATALDELAPTKAMADRVIEGAEHAFLRLQDWNATTRPEWNATTRPELRSAG